MKTYTHKGHQIEPKRDFGPGGYLDGQGRVCTKGWVVVKDYCNAMPGGTWFATVREAREAINVLLRVNGNAVKFWEIMQPFEYVRIGQRANFANGSVQKGRFKAIIENFKVIKIIRNAK